MVQQLCVFLLSWYKRNKKSRTNDSSPPATLHRVCSFLTRVFIKMFFAKKWKPLCLLIYLFCQNYFESFTKWSFRNKFANSIVQQLSVFLLFWYKKNKKSRTEDSSPPATLHRVCSFLRRVFIRIFFTKKWNHLFY